jgi:O-antigen ligase
MYTNLNNILLISYFGLFVLEGRFREKLNNLKSDYHLITPLALIFLLVLMAAINPVESIGAVFKHLEKNWSLLIIPVTIIACKDEYAKIWRNIFSALLWGCVATLLICYGNVIYEMIAGKEPLHYFWRYRHLNHQFTNIADTHPAYLGLFIVTSIAFLFLEKSMKKGVKLLLFLFFLLGLLQLASRMALLCVILLAAYFLWTKFKNHWKQILIGLGVISIVGIVFLNTGSSFMKDRLISIEQLENDERIKRYKISYEIFTENLIFGIGATNKDEVRIKKYLEQDFMVAALEKYNAHNQFLEYLSVNGIIGGLVFIFVFAYIFFIAWKKQQYFLLCVMILFFMANLTESMFVRIKGIEFFAITVSLLLIVKKKKELT